ncbi:MAG TPA: class I SAM-dependent methyltransferase [Ktedonobacteraceae bacterium]|jgi:16S rRNA (guanine1207-N2)-methyltransferase
MFQSLLAQTLHCALNEHAVIVNSAADPCVLPLAEQVGAGEMVLAEDNVAAWERAWTGVHQPRRQRLCLRHVPLHEYAACEAPATMELAAMNIVYQPDNTWMRYGVRLAAYALKVGGRLYVEGAKDRGILSLGRYIQEIFGNLETLAISKGRRLVCAVKSVDSAGELALPDLAPFAAGRIDEGTRLLLDSLEVRVSDTALDPGCGAGFIGAYIAERASRGQVTLLDVSLVSVAAARRLLEQRGLVNVQVLASDGMQAVRDRRFDLVATNPPFHLGGIQTTAIAQRFIHETARVLRPRGRFYLVANRFLKYEPVLRACFGTVEEVGGNTRFKVLRSLH